MIPQGTEERKPNQGDCPDMMPWGQRREKTKQLQRKFNRMGSVMGVNKRVNGDTFSELYRRPHCGILTLC